MGLLSGTTSITRYKIEGKYSDSILENISSRLEKYKIKEIDGTTEQNSVGWTEFGNPFNPNFINNSVLFGNFLIFSLRIDKKTIPSKLLRKLYLEKIKNRLKEDDRGFLTKDEKEAIRNSITDNLCIKIPANPNIYDLVWNYEEKLLWFFTNIKSANQALESIFRKTFDLSLIRLFPYTMANYFLEDRIGKIDQLHHLSHK